MKDNTISSQESGKDARGGRRLKAMVKGALFSSYLGFAILGPLVSIVFYLVTYRTATFVRERRTGADIS